MGKKRHSVWIIGIMVLTILLLVNAAGAASFEYWNETPDGIENRAIIQLYDAPVLSYAAVLQSKLMLKQEEIDKLEKELAIDTGNKFLQSQLMDARTEFENEKILIDAKIITYRDNIFNIHSNIKNEIAQNNLEIKILREYTGIFNGFAVEASKENIDKLKNIANIKAVYTDRKVYASLQDSVPLINATAVWQIQNVSGINITGKNVRVAVIDTGIDYNHPDLGGGFGPGYRVIAGWDVFNNDSDPIDDHGHGTHVAGIVAANGSIKGVAPDAQLMAYKVLSAGGWGWWSDVIDGIERAVDPDGNPLTDDGADIISMSLGGWGNPDDPVSQSVDNADAAGVLVVVAAGNSGPYNNSIGSPGTARKALTVGATTKSDEIASFSSRGPVTWANGSMIKPEVVAPGVLINSTITNMSTPLGSPTGYRKLSGTSMATPHVSGAAALLLQLHPDWTPEELKSALITTAVDLDYDVYTQGAGRIDVLKAAGVEALVNQSILSLGIVNTRDEFWQVERNINLRNIAGVSKSFNISVAIPYYSGVTANLSQTNVSLNSGAGTVFNFSLTVNNSVVSAGNYEGDIIIKSDSNVLRIPFAFIKSPASLNSIYGDYGIDTDGNGLYDYLAVDVGVDVSKAGYYRVIVDLHSSDNYHLTENSTYRYLPSGRQNVTVLLDGIDIRRNRINGSYMLDDVWLLDGNWNLVDVRDDPYTTNYYNYTDFQRPPAEFMPGIKDFGLDTNSNGLYDYLVVEKQVNVTSAGYYEVDGYLYNSSGYYMGSVYNYTYLSAGIHNITLKFDGWKIYRTNSTGNFTVYTNLYGYSGSGLSASVEPENRMKKLSTERDAIEPKLTESQDINFSAIKPLAISQQDVGITWWRWLDSVIDTTKYYSYTQFERPPARFNDEYSDYGLDTDSNGYYDYIAIDVGVNVSRAGYYYVSGYLYNSSGWYIASTSNYTSLNPGNQTIQLRFDGARIWQYRTNGTFDLKYLYLYNSTNWDWLDYRYDAYTTKAYNYTDFRPQAVFMPGIKDYGLDENNNSLYDYLVIEKQVNVTVTGSYEVDGYLYNPSGYYIGSAYNYTTLNAGLQNITLRFDGVRIYRSNSTGNFTVNTYLYGYSSSGLSVSAEKMEKLAAAKNIVEPKLQEINYVNNSAIQPLAVSEQQVGVSSWRWFDSAIDNTGNYNYTQFERPPAQFNDEYSDYGLDTDSNGFYDYIAIDVGVNVSRAGYFQISGSLYNSTGWYWIDSATNYTYLNPGNQTVQLRFNGARIWMSRTNGTFDLKYLGLYSAGGWWDDYRDHAYTTKAYNYTDFRPQAVFMPGIKDYGLDENSNGLYDYLVIEKQVNVTVAGSYEVDGYLYNPSGNSIGSAYNYTTLNAGLQNITLRFDGVRIYRSNSTGNFTVYTYLYGYSSSGLSASTKSENTEKLPVEKIIEKTILEQKLAENISSNASALKPLAVSQEQIGATWWRWFDSAIDTTKYYSYTQFEQPPARFSDVYSDYGLDPDANGYYDYLVIDVGVNVSRAGYYYVSGSLYDSSGWYWIDSASNYTKLKAGNNTLQLRFNGANIWYYRINGTFDLKYLGLYNTSDWWDEFDYRYYAYTTKYYTFTDFDYPGKPDAYEPDDNYSNATYISTDGIKQTHNFHTPGDRDWMKFNATAGSSYILEISELGLDSDTYMYLYAPDLTEIASDDDSGEGLASRINWTSNTTDTYYIMVRHYSSSAFGRNTYYNISVRVNYTILPNQSAYGMRDIEHQSVGPNGSTNVTVNITSNITQALSLQEVIPAGWALTRISDDSDSFKVNTSEWVWFNVTAGATKTVIYRVTMPANASAGTYYINGTISNASGMIAIVGGENTISTDILSYYRSLGNDPNIVETTDLLKAADDWSMDIAPPGFAVPITTPQLLALADEWARS